MTESLPSCFLGWGWGLIWVVNMNRVHVCLPSSLSASFSEATVTLPWVCSVLSAQLCNPDLFIQSHLGHWLVNVLHPLTPRLGGTKRSKPPPLAHYDSFLAAWLLASCYVETQCSTAFPVQSQVRC